MGIFKSKNIFQWGPIDGAPLPIHYSALSSIKDMYEKLGIGWPLTILTFKGDKLTWFNDLDLLNSIGKQIVRNLIIPKNKKRIIDKLWDNRIRELIKIGSKIVNIKSSSLSRSQLKTTLIYFNKVYLNFWNIGMLAELVNYGAEELLRENLILIKSKNIEEKMTQLCSPTFLSFYTKEELDLLSIIIKNKIDNNKNLTDARRNKKLLNNHIKKYYFILNNYYQTKILDEDYFISKIKGILAKNINPNTAIDKILNHITYTKKNKEKLIKILGLDNKSKLFIKIIDEFMEFQDIRKYYNLYADHLLDLLLGEIAKRENKELQDLKYLLPEEIIQFIDGKNFDLIINKRKKFCVIKYDIKKFKVLKEKEATKVYNSLFPEYINKDIREFKGTIANRGIATGYVKILHSIKEVDKMNEGDILVTSMTSPEFVVAIKKCSAIITDVGGLTSHAAVVSREFKKPCIINTKIATKVLKDGDYVEVDAINGVIKKL